MKAATIIRLAIGLFIIPFLVSCLVLAPQQAQAQDSGYLEPSEKYSREELAQMLAPIALYPDKLLSQILMASTYPIEVIEADRWVRMNPELEGEALDDALLDEDWAPSVKAICHFPSILALMSERITETSNLGNAFLAQEDEVMDTIQELRAKAYAQGNLATTSEQKIVVEKETIIIEPAYPSVFYVPYYDPFYIYGPWWYPAYPPYYWGPLGINVGIGISYWPGFYFGFSFGTWCYFDWHHHYIYIDVRKRPRYVRHDRWIATPGRWQHVPHHRRGVAYRDKSTARKYGQSSHRSGDYRRDTRGFPEPRDPGLDRDWRVNDRTRIDLDKGGDDRTIIDRERQVLERAERDRPVQRQVERDRQERAGIERERKARERVDRDLLKRERAKRERVDRDLQKQERAKCDRPVRQQADQEQQPRQRVEREQQQRSRDNIFNRVEDGRRERESSERGRVSRQGRGEAPRVWDRSGRND